MNHRSPKGDLLAEEVELGGVGLGEALGGLILLVGGLWGLGCHRQVKKVVQTSNYLCITIHMAQENDELREALSLLGDLLEGRGMPGIHLIGHG